MLTDYTCIAVKVFYRKAFYIINLRAITLRKCNLSFIVTVILIQQSADLLIKIIINGREKLSSF